MAFAFHTQPSEHESASRSAHEPIEPPVGLSREQVKIWKLYAPLAVDRRTLIASTVPAFRLLCELEVRKALAAEKAATGGVSETRLFLQLAKQVEALMARFGLAPFGKPLQAAVGASQQASVDGDAAFFGSSRRG